MKDTVIGENTVIDKSIIAENCKIGDNGYLESGKKRLTNSMRVFIPSGL